MELRSPNNHNSLFTLCAGCHGSDAHTHTDLNTKVIYFLNSVLFSLSAVDHY